MESIEVSNSLAESKPTQTKKLKISEKFHPSSAEVKKIDLWIEQVRLSTKGYLALNKFDFVSFLISEHPSDLSPKEIRRIRQAHYDPMKHISWIATQIKIALSKQDMARVDELQQELRGIEAAAAQKLKRAPTMTNSESNNLSKRTRKKKVDALLPATALATTGGS